MFRFVAAFVVALALLPLPVSAMQFSIVGNPGGPRMVLATGPIQEGDARRLARALSLATPDKHGTLDLLLNSPGGTVYDAMQMADIMAGAGVSTVVPSNAVCASACASVLFVAGKYRTIQPGGQLAIHSCFDARNGVKMDDCDAAIAARAEQEGVSGRAMMAFQELAGADHVVMFSAADAACFGLTRAFGKASLGDNAPCVQAAMHGRPLPLKH